MNSNLCIFGNLESKDKEPQLCDPVMILHGKLANTLKKIISYQVGVLQTIISFCSSENAVEFLTDLGCRLEFEYVAKGFVFRKGRMKITVR